MPDVWPEVRAQDELRERLAVDKCEKCLAAESEPCGNTLTYTLNGVTDTLVCTELKGHDDSHYTPYKGAWISEPAAT